MKYLLIHKGVRDEKLVLYIGQIQKGNKVGADIHKRRMGVCSSSRDGKLVTSPTFWMERLTADLERRSGLKE